MREITTGHYQFYDRKTPMELNNFQTLKKNYQKKNVCTDEGLKGIGVKIALTVLIFLNHQVICSVTSEFRKVLQTLTLKS